MFVVFTGCSQVSIQTAPNVIVLEPKNNRLHFSGKGAGAGMMLMSSMGAMGIAIGVAIDEGIAKTISKSADEANVDISNITEKAFLRVAEPCGDITVVVDKYGFITTQNRTVNDAVQPIVELKVERLKKDVPAVYLKSNTQNGVCANHVYPLERIKSDGYAVGEALEKTLGCMAERYGNVSCGG